MSPARGAASSWDVVRTTSCGTKPAWFRVFVSAGMDFRVQRVVKRDGITEDEARDRIRSMDKARSAYYNFNTEQKWGAAQNYDLCLNVSQWGTDGSVELILCALRQAYPDLCG